MNNWFKRNGIHLAIIGIFIALCFVYFSPVIQGKSLIQSDVQQAQGTQKEIMDFKAKDGKAPLWTNSQFGGMPAYQVWAQYPSNVTTYVISFFKAIFPNPIYTVMLYLLGAYLLFCVLRMNPWLAAAGAIAFTFSSYNFILIEAGHANQALAIAFFAPVLAGIILTFRGNYLLGSALTALFLAIEIRSNHIQMTYYLAIALIILVGIEFYHSIKNKTTKNYIKSLSYLTAAMILAVAVNAGSLWTTYEYGQESTRGKSNLKTEESTPNSGLDRAYAYQWSQGVGELITFLIPNAYGGAWGPIMNEDSKIAKVLSDKGVPADQVSGFMQQGPSIGLNSYWGEKPYTSGPFYFGAVICFLFVLGLFIVKGRIKWWIVGASTLILFLSFGKNLPFISDLFFNYFPLYNKFRAVESIIAVVGLLVPILAILAIKEVCSKSIEPKKLQAKCLYSLYITGGLLLIMIMLPDLLFGFKASNHEEFIQQMMQLTGNDKGFADAISNALVQDRISLARADAIRSLIFVLLGAGLVWGLIKEKIKPQFAFMILTGLILVDLWTVDRRYLNKENFSEGNILEKAFEPTEIDKMILRDETYYRVLDLTVSTFQSAKPSYFYKAIGGYHAAKLKRFQEIIEKQFNNAINEDVLDMLNTKYVITNEGEGENQSQKIKNRETAAGNAWFVPKVTYVKGADEEMAAINSFDPQKEAFVDENFKTVIDEKKVGYDPSGMIKLTSYRPDHLTYEYSIGKDMIAVFSEVYYDKGWNAYVDGEKIPHFRANYILRAAQLPGGNHKLEFKFEPKSYYTGETISLIASILLILGLAYAIYREVTPQSPKGEVLAS